MTGKEAGKIFQNGPQYECDGASTPYHRYIKATGYLEAIEKAKGLESVIKKYTQPHNQKEVKCRSCYLNMREAFAKWEKEK